MVKDPPGAVIGGAVVTITQPATGFTRTVNTAPNGSYEVRYLQPGEYNLEVTMAGFKTDRHTGIVLQISQLARIDVILQLGEVKETVEVSSAARCSRPRTPCWAKWWRANASSICR